MIASTTWKYQIHVWWVLYYLWIKHEINMVCLYRSPATNARVTCPIRVHIKTCSVSISNWEPITYWLNGNYIYFSSTFWSLSQRDISNETCLITYSHWLDRQTAITTNVILEVMIPGQAGLNIIFHSGDIKTYLLLNISVCNLVHYRSMWSQKWYNLISYKKAFYMM